MMTLGSESMTAAGATAVMVRCVGRGGFATAEDSGDGRGKAEVSDGGAAALSSPAHPPLPRCSSPVPQPVSPSGYSGRCSHSAATAHSIGRTS